MLQGRPVSEKLPQIQAQATHSALAAGQAGDYDGSSVEGLRTTKDTL